MKKNLQSLTSQPIDFDGWMRNIYYWCLAFGLRSIELLKVEASWLRTMYDGGFNPKEVVKSEMLSMAVTSRKKKKKRRRNE